MIPRNQLDILCDLHDTLEDVYDTLSTWHQVNCPANGNLAKINASLALNNVMSAIDFLQIAKALARSEHGKADPETKAGWKESASDRKESCGEFRTTSD